MTQITTPLYTYHPTFRSMKICGVKIHSVFLRVNIPCLQKDINEASANHKDEYHK